MLMIVTSDALVTWLRDEDTLTGRIVLPEFTCPVAAHFEGVARMEE